MLWSAVFITVSTLYRPVDQYLSRHVSEHLAQGHAIGEPLRVAAKIQLGLALAFAAARPDLPRPAPERPAERRRDALLGLLRRRPRLCRELLRPRLPRRDPLLRPVLDPDPLRVDLPHLVRRDRRGRALQRPVRGRDGHRRGAVPQPRRRPSRISAPAPAGRDPPPPPRREPAGGGDSAAPEMSLAHGTRVRRGGPADHAQRADLPQRRPAPDPGDGGSGRRRLHLQRADDRPRAPAALPGRLDEPPPPPHEPPHGHRGRGRRGLPALDPHGEPGDRRLHRGRRRRGPDRRPAADAARLLGQVRI